MKRMKRPLARGFSLLEVVVAITILGIAFSVLFSGLSGALRGMERVEAADARTEMARSLFTAIDLLGPLAPNDTALGRFDDGTLWRIETAEYSPSMLRLTLRLEWQGTNGAQDWTLHTYKFSPPQGTRAPRALQQQMDELR